MSGVESTTASLHADQHQVTAGGEATLILRVVPPPGWHVYWRNPGDSGLPTAVAWTLPSGVSVGEPVWPLPQRFDDSDLISFGYENELLLSFPLQLDADLPPGPIRLEARVDWLACRASCVPGRAELALDLIVAEQSVPDPEGAGLHARARAEQPSADSPWRVTAQVHPTRIVLDLHPLTLDSPQPERLQFIPATESVLALGEPQHWQPGPLPQLVLPRASGFELPATLDGLVVAGEDLSGPGWLVSVPLDGALQP